MNLSDSIDILSFEDINSQTFNEKYISANKPALIRGLLENTDAGQLWNVTNLKNRIGNFSVKVFKNSEKSGTSYLMPKHQVKMAEMLDLIETNSESDYRMFVNPILKKDKLFASELPCPDFFKCKLQLSNLLFIGGKGCIVPLHFDFMKDDGLLTHFFGQKEVILIDNAQSKLLYQIPFNTTSPVNLFNPDYDTYPQLRNIKGTRVTLNHGDTLYIPSGYWHQLKYVDASMSVAFRKWNPSPIANITRALRLSLEISFDKTTNFVLGQKWYQYKMQIARKRAIAEREKVHNGTYQT